MIPFRGEEGIKNLYLTERCDICGKKRKYIALCGSICVRCSVWTKRRWCYLIAKYIRFSIRKYVHGEGLKIISIPGNYTGNLKAGDSI